MTDIIGILEDIDIQKKKVLELGYFRRKYEFCKSFVYLCYLEFYCSTWDVDRYNRYLVVRELIEYNPWTDKNGDKKPDWIR